MQVSVLAVSTRVRGFKPGRSRRTFLAKKILSTPSFGGEVKPSVPCRKFTTCKRTQKWRGSRHFRQNLVHSSIFRCWGSIASFQKWGTSGGGRWNVLITGPPSWEFDVPLATALCKNPSCWEYSTIVEQAKTHKGCSADWRKCVREYCSELDVEF